MRKIFLSFDIYGIKPEFKLFGKKRHKTCFGSVMSVLTVCISIVSCYLFGSDFIHKINPRIVSQESISKEVKVIYPTSTSFAVMFQLINAPLKAYKLEELKTKVRFSFTYAKKDDKNDLKVEFSTAIVPAKCSETLAAQNENLKEHNLENLYCLDWEALVEQYGESLPFGGFLEDSQFSLFRVEVGNYGANYETIEDLVDYSEIKEEIRQTGLKIKIYYPSFFFDVDSREKPINIMYDSFIYNLNSEVNRVDRHFFEVAYLEDDLGWIFKDKTNFEAVRHDKYQTESAIINYSEGQIGAYNMYSFLGYLNKKNTIFRRNYMKVQELAALAGGLIKITHFCFSNIVFLFANFDMEMFFVSKFEVQAKRLNNHKSVISSSINRSVSRLETAKTLANKVNISYFQLVLSKFKLGSKRKEIEKFNEEKKKLFGKIDFGFLIYFFRELEEFLANSQKERQSISTGHCLKKVFDYSKIINSKNKI